MAAVSRAVVLPSIAAFLLLLLFSLSPNPHQFGCLPTHATFSSRRGVSVDLLLLLLLLLVWLSLLLVLLLFCSCCFWCCCFCCCLYPSPLLFCCGGSPAAFSTAVETIQSPCVHACMYAHTAQELAGRRALVGCIVYSSCMHAGQSSHARTRQIFLLQEAKGDASANSP